uniref:NADH-ubiquinone oxidoreductase chain 6 n=1 Tax=Batrachomoeus trispinosus TaxID=262770 RepID=Q5GM94_9TELE|nr:NADH dehydrogenase subunit 6 [Batrachomoeus trispinosus]
MMIKDMILSVGLIFGLVVVVANPFPFYGALGLVLASGLGCLVLLGLEGSFLSLVLFLIYLGGMLVVFAYTTALAAEVYPRGLGTWEISRNVTVNFVLVMVVFKLVYEGLSGLSWVVGPSEGFKYIMVELGVVELYQIGYLMLFGGVVGLLVTLFSVLSLTWGFGWGALR